MARERRQSLGRELRPFLIRSHACRRGPPPTPDAHECLSTTRMERFGFSELGNRERIEEKGEILMRMLDRNSRGFDLLGFHRLRSRILEKRRESASPLRMPSSPPASSQEPNREGEQTVFLFLLLLLLLEGISGPMESKKTSSPSASSTSSVDEFVGRTNAKPSATISSSSSRPGYFSTVIPPASANKEGKPVYPNESIESPCFGSSVHYGARDFYTSSSSTHTSGTRKNVAPLGNGDGHFRLRSDALGGVGEHYGAEAGGVLAHPLHRAAAGRGDLHLRVSCRRRARHHLESHPLHRNPPAFAGPLHPLPPAAVGQQEQRQHAQMLHPDLHLVLFCSDDEPNLRCCRPFILPEKLLESQRCAPPQDPVHHAKC
ncbi:hypothetical protein B296_00033199 [Ensete ventricosum]|uniref:Uncharacterized protein n=1 Tax=Ensete ventricosum TaxID=4639 RepID=A0A426YLU2_ENSVE|nr:hypothetical protein B296_00033199 [Ensete ventricosum]